MKSSCSICEGYHDEDNSSRPRSRRWTRNMISFPRPTPGRVPFSAPRSKSPFPSGQNPPHVAISQPFLPIHLPPHRIYTVLPNRTRSRIRKSYTDSAAELSSFSGRAKDANRIKSAQSPPPRAPSPSAASAGPAWETARTADSPASRPSGPGPRRPAPRRPASPATAWVRPRCS